MIMKFVVSLLIALRTIAANRQSTTTNSGFIKAKTLSIYYELTGKVSPVFLLVTLSDL